MHRGLLGPLQLFNPLHADLRRGVLALAHDGVDKLPLEAAHAFEAIRSWCEASRPGRTFCAEGLFAAFCKDASPVSGAQLTLLLALAGVGAWGARGAPPWLMSRCASLLPLLELNSRDVVGGLAAPRAQRTLDDAWADACGGGPLRPAASSYLPSALARAFEALVVADQAAGEANWCAIRDDRNMRFRL